MIQIRTTHCLSAMHKNSSKWIENHFRQQNTIWITVLVPKHETDTVYNTVLHILYCTSVDAIYMFQLETYCTRMLEVCSKTHKNNLVKIHEIYYWLARAQLFFYIKYPKPNYNKLVTSVLFLTITYKKMLTSFRTLILQKDVN
jgi:hypothetical protein